MGAEYKAIGWTPHKKVYDYVLSALVIVYLTIFASLSSIITPEAALATVAIRALGSLALLLLHFILAIGPLCRFSTSFLPFLYNRRHLGVFMFLVALVHGIFSLSLYHSDGNMFFLNSLFLSNTHYDSLVFFPFQVLGFFALIILLVMASTSHDFWLKILSPLVWKSIHMGVYLAYALVILHVTLGALQLEKAPIYIWLLGTGIATLTGLHVSSGILEHNARRKQKVVSKLTDDGFIEVCRTEDIVETRAKMFILEGQNIAVFKYDNKISAIHNLCKHQNGPLGEGKIIDGCITCPWHGYQYKPADGASPPPFTEKVATYHTKVVGGKVFVNPNSLPEGTYVEPSII